LTRPVRLSALAAQDLQQARDWFDAREAGMGDKFLNSVEHALDRISRNVSGPAAAARFRLQAEPQPTSTADRARDTKIAPSR
jgi:hypothetical protein